MSIIIIIAIIIIECQRLPFALLLYQVVNPSAGATLRTFGGGAYWILDKSDWFRALKVLGTA